MATLRGVRLDLGGMLLILLSAIAGCEAARQAPSAARHGSESRAVPSGATLPRPEVIGPVCDDDTFVRVRNGVVNATLEVVLSTDDTIGVVVMEADRETRVDVGGRLAAGMNVSAVQFLADGTASEESDSVNVCCCSKACFEGYQSNVPIGGDTGWRPAVCPSTTKPLFASAQPHEIMEFEIEADWDVINDPNLTDAPSDKEKSISQGTLRYTDLATNQTVSLPVVVTGRGHSRFQFCEYKPLRVDFGGKQRGNIFEGHKKIKLVTHCGNHPIDSWVLGGTTKVQRRRLLSEYYFYRLLQTQNSAGLSVRLGRMTYKNPDGTDRLTELVFWREPEKDACKRCGWDDEADDAELGMLVPDEESVFQASMYNEFVYNKDYDAVSGHNTVVCKDAAAGFYIPYDWDLTGVVRPEYWKNVDANNNPITYQQNAAEYATFLATPGGLLRTKTHAWHIIRHDEEMRAILEGAILDEPGKAQMLGWYDLYMRILKCFAGMSPGPGYTRSKFRLQESALAVGGVGLLPSEEGGLDVDDPDIIEPATLPDLQFSVQLSPGSEVSPRLRTLLAETSPRRTSSVTGELILSGQIDEVIPIAEELDSVTQVEIARPKSIHPAPSFVIDPATRRPFNRDARLSHNVHEFEDTFHDGQGATVRAAIFDAGKVWATHEEFKRDRVTIVDKWAAFNPHATHVAGTMSARGDPKVQARGMAPRLLLRSFYFGRKRDLDKNTSDPDADDDDLDRLAKGAKDLQITNHSYGPRIGWDSDQDQSGNRVWIWWGGTVGKEDARFGKYTIDASRIDAILHDNPQLLSVVAAGNDRTDAPPFQPIEHYVPTYDQITRKLKWTRSTKVREVDGYDNGGLDTVSGLCLSKNALCVGAMNDVFENGQPIPGAHLQTTSFSAWGPTDDGRIKPDLVANGDRLISPIPPPANAINVNRAYRRLSGTSMASPTAAGIAALLAEFFQVKTGTLPMSAELKAILIHTATDAGEQGPDPKFGWGSINAFRAGEVIASQQGLLGRQKVSPENSWSLRATAQAGRSGQPVRVTVAWLDPPAGANQGGLDDDTRTLVNDLDLVLESPSGETLYPYRLDPSNPPGKSVTDGPNRVDNVEVVDAPWASGIWTIRVSAASLGSGSEQEFAVVADGLVPVP